MLQAHRRVCVRLFSTSVLSLAVMMVWIYRNERTSMLPTNVPSSPSRIQTLPTVSPDCGSGVIVPKGQLVNVNGTTTLLVSAFQEHRTKTREVRVIAVSQRSKELTYLCLLCCEGHIHISKGVNNVLSSHFHFAYGTSHLMCPVPDSCETPSHISAVSTDVQFTEVGHFLEVENLQPRAEAFPHNFTVCISAMFEFSNVLQLVQSFEMLSLLGATRVVVYKTSASPETQQVLDYYTQKGFAEVIPWTLSRFLSVSRSWLPELSPGDIHYFGQLPALNDCVYRNMYQTWFLALHDVDELILPQTVSSWSELLPLLVESHGVDQCFSFENNLFPTNVILAPPKSEALHPASRWHPGSQSAPGVNILAHLYHEPSEKFRDLRRKLMVNPRGVISPNIHELEQAEFKCVWVDRDVGRMYHTRSPLQAQLTPDQLVYDGRLLNYSSRLIPAVTSVLAEAGRAPGNLEHLLAGRNHPASLALA